MNFFKIMVSMGSMGIFGALFSIGLSLANKRLHVVEDPRIEKITEALPGINCGACGFAGCSNFAENLVNGSAELSSCKVASSQVIEEIAEILGVEVTACERNIARVMCQGGINETSKKASYIGIQSCIATHIISGGEKLCEYGCLGFGDCVEACPFDAMYMSENGLPVVIEEKCIGCGECVNACPRDIIELHPVSHKLFVLCKNHDTPKESRRICTRACIGCGICVRAAGDGKILMDENLAKVNYEVYGKESVLPTERCPTKCLVIKESKNAIIAAEVPEA